MNSKSATSTGLQSLALALIFMPEPFTTPIGILLLAYAKSMGPDRPTTPRRVINSFDDLYSYKMDMQRNSVITYQLSARRHGQLPEAYPKMASLQDNPHYVKALRTRTKGPSPYTSTPFSKLEPPGLMKGPKLKDRAALALPSKVANPKFRSVIT
jgi:hypothetical protein